MPRAVQIIKGISQVDVWLMSLRETLNKAPAQQLLVRECLRTRRAGPGPQPIHHPPTFPANLISERWRGLTAAMALPTRVVPQRGCWAGHWRGLRAVTWHRSPSISHPASVTQHWSPSIGPSSIQPRALAAPQSPGSCAGPRCSSSGSKAQGSLRFPPLSEHQVSLSNVG